MIPLFYDQFRNANMMVRQEVAISLKTDDLASWQTVDEAMKSILFHEKYTKNAKKLAELLKNQPNSPKDTVIKYTEFVGELVIK